tara:strand:- start:6148 stop:6249 length:102 start_codon:yes stop_codon:yes gene_type:complete
MKMIKGYLSEVVISCPTAYDLAHQIKSLLTNEK